MKHGIIFAAAASLLAAGCAAPQPGGPVHTDTTPSVAFQPGSQKLDLDRGIWGTQPITPPQGLVTVQQTNLIGRTIDSAGGTPYLNIKYLLADPTTGDARYAVTTANDFFGEYLAVPLSVLQITPTSIRVDATTETLKRMPRFTMAELQQRYPLTTLAGTPRVPPPAVATTIPPVIPARVPPVPPAAQPLQLAHSGSVVGYPVFDSDNRSVGVVSAVGAVPTTGEVRYAMVSGPRIGADQYIAVPAANVQVVGDRVVLNAPLSVWLGMRHYTRGQIPQILG